MTTILLHSLNQGRDPNLIIRRYCTIKFDLRYQDQRAYKILSFLKSRVVNPTVQQLQQKLSFMVQQKRMLTSLLVLDLIQSSWDALINTSLYGLRALSARFHEQCTENLRLEVSNHPSLSVSFWYEWYSLQQSSNICS